MGNGITVIGKFEEKVLVDFDLTGKVREYISTLTKELGVGKYNNSHTYKDTNGVVVMVEPMTVVYDDIYKQREISYRLEHIYKNVLGDYRIADRAHQIDRKYNPNNIFFSVLTKSITLCMSQQYRKFYTAIPTSDKQIDENLPKNLKIMSKTYKTLVGKNKALVRQMKKGWDWSDVNFIVKENREKVVTDYVGHFYDFDTQNSLVLYVINPDK